MLTAHSQIDENSADRPPRCTRNVVVVFHNLDFQLAYHRLNALHVVVLTPGRRRVTAGSPPQPGGREDL